MFFFFFLHDKNPFDDGVACVRAGAKERGTNLLSCVECVRAGRVNGFDGTYIYR